MAPNGVKILLAPTANLLGSLASLLVLLSPYVTTAQVKPLIQITTGIYDIRLGTRITDVAKTYPMKETQDPRISLYRKFGLGDPDKEEIVGNKP